MLRSSRPVLTILAVTAATALAGCGGSDDKGGSGNSDAYAKTYQTACQTLTEEFTSFQSDLEKIPQQAAKAPQKAVAAYRDRTVALFDAFLSQLDSMRSAEAPGKYQDFQGKMQKDLASAVDGLQTAKKTMGSVKTTKDLTTLGQKLGAINIKTQVELPKDLLEKAPACKVLGKA